MSVMKGARNRDRMRAAVTRQAHRGRVEIIDVPQPTLVAGAVLIAMREVGIDQTDHEVIEGTHGSNAPSGDDYLILGHESLGQVIDLGSGATGFRSGDWVVCTVRRPDGCPNCRRGEIDMCLWGRYTERGIKGAHGYLAELVAEQTAYVIPVPSSVRAVGALIEPLSICEKAIGQARRIQRRLHWRPRTALVFGLGTIGILAAMLLRLRGLDVYVYSRTPHDSLQARLIAEIGVHYINTDDIARPGGLRGVIPRSDLMIEATGAASVAADAMTLLEPNAVLCLLSVTPKGDRIEMDVADVNQRIVLGNAVVFGSVNSGRRHFERAIHDLERVEVEWPGFTSRLITRRVPFEKSADAFTQRDEDIKVLIELGDGLRSV
jgi:threonine dehydrogenase-like Zn-dependent dehydrogenase